MRAVHQAGYGRREQLSVKDDVPRPTPDANSVLVEIKACSVNAGDHHMLTGRPYMIRMAVGRPQHGIPGMDFSGVVIEVGSEAGKTFSIGDDVFGTVDVAGGAFAEFVSAPSNMVVKKP